MNIRKDVIKTNHLPKNSNSGINFKDVQVFVQADVGLSPHSLAHRKTVTLMRI